ncbi:MAG: hypothetical protein FWH01_18205 [Oscillospiraceae bacterium]|nr:hypothetical protein [Oscillospiraceae bacterium]
MGRLQKAACAAAAIAVAAIVAAALFLAATPTGRSIWNNWVHRLRKADDATRYDTRRAVEDACRAMIASHTADSLTYEQHRYSDSAEKQGWAEQAKMRANRTAAAYNEYILKNSYVWEGNVPEDIMRSLKYLE